MRHHRIAATAVAALATLSLAACSTTPATTATSSPPPAATSEPPMTTPATAGTIVEVASANPDFSTLVAAVKAAGLVDTLNGAGPFTVFAPTNAAFEALPEGLVDKLLEPANKDTLVKILTYHVVSGKVMAADVTAGKVPTVEGSELTIATDGGVMVNNAKVTATDVAASNGVIHVIDKVLVPAGVDVSNL